MRRWEMRIIAVALGGALALVAVAADAQPQHNAHQRTAALDVPYVSQSELLCGGAAAAMLLRYWGARGVYAEDFAPSVDRRAGGITTSALESAVREKGWRATAFSASDEEIRQALDRSEPVIALIEDRPGRYHYVVIVSWQDGSVVYHDPARGPLRSRDAHAFDRSWAAAKRWAMIVLPGEGSLGSQGSAAQASESADDDAIAAFAQRNYRESARLAGERLRRNPGDADAWRILGASRYLDSRKIEALDAWNHAGEPRIDLVTFDGLDNTPQRAVERLVGITPRTVLTSGQLRRADRRLALLPAAESTSLTYTALPEGLAEVTGAVVEQSRVPRLTDWLMQAVKFPFTREVSVGFGNVFSRGGHWTALWRFQEARPAVRFAVDLPAAPLPGIWSIDTAWEKKTFLIGAASATTSRRDGRLGWTDWVAADTRLMVGAGVARWAERGTRGVIDAAIQQRALSDHLAFGIGGSIAPGTSPFGTVIGHLAWRTGTTPLRLIGSIVTSRASAETPIDLWPYAGAGSGRELLLRAHDLHENGALVNEVFGRHVDQGTIEVQRDVYSRGMATLAIAGFTDMGRISRRADGSASPFEVDAGVGIRVRTGADDRMIRVDIARALRDDGVVLSAGWQVTWFDRKVRR